MNLVVFELKSEAMKERHWKTLLKKIHMQNMLWREITLGQLWNINLIKYDN